MRSAAVGVLLTLALCGSPRVATADGIESVFQVPASLGVDVELDSTASRADTLRLVAFLSPAGAGQLARARLHLMIPRELEVVVGDTLVEMHGPRDVGLFTLLVRARGGDRWTIGVSGEEVTQDGERYFAAKETEVCRKAIGFGVTRRELKWWVAAIGTQWFRYLGDWRIPVDSASAFFDERMIGHLPVLKEAWSTAVDVPCDNCGSGVAVDTVLCVVAVDAHGKVSAVRAANALLGRRNPSVAIRQRAIALIEGGGRSSAVIGGGGVPGWKYVRVVVRRDP